MSQVITPYAQGTPCWVDLMASDLQTAINYYCDLFGWEGEPGPPEVGGYTVCTLKGRPVAGIGPAMAMDGQPAPSPAWTTYLAADSADDVAGKISKSGGKVVAPPMDVMSLGRMLVAVDPTGLAFGVWQPRDFHGAQIVNEPGAMCWNEANTPDPAAAKRFYSNAFGIDVAPMEGAEDYFALNVGGNPVGGMAEISKDTPKGMQPSWLTYFAVEDTDSTVDTHVKRGGDVLQAPFDMVAGRMAVLRDPQGATFAVIKMAPMGG
jgi:uncharacterized protein